MARIGGDVADLPAGWEVDPDNWGRRLVRNGDFERMRSVKATMAVQCFIEDGFLYTMSAEAAAAIDAA